MDDAERQRRNDAIYARSQSRSHTRWLEKKVIEMSRQRLRETVTRLQAEQEAS
ncbi:hypothetical protein [Streptomyces sp. NBC_01237]|uniref:hypothetical protein n=1 Tax=Streptomyces sp. NBC_01237 TaxID=2903790 RepID=UPI002DDA79FE|nr:hypothetical protein [Streptomyces sp. NBC_01237]WRZ72875.1 hypothetical protein OG251_15255 [Streptomyces sp. NBC_01237]